MKSNLYALSGVCCGVFLTLTIVGMFMGNVFSVLGWICAAGWSLIYLLKGE